MRDFYALYDNNDNFITCGYKPRDMIKNYNHFWSALHRNKQIYKSIKVFKIPLQPQDDIFKEEDELFLQEEGDNVYFDREIAEREKITLRSLYRRRLKQKNNDNKNL